jgi:hypothetical protein
MKKVFALALVLGLAACAPKENAAPTADTAATAAPATTDTMAPAATDTMKKDTAATAPAAH